MLKENKDYKRFVWEFSNILKCNKIKNNIIFLCIGTNKIIGDSFGPIVGTQLKQNLKPLKNVKVIGDLENNISYCNIDENMNKLVNSVEKNFIIVVDSALSTEDNIGKVFVHNRGLKYAESLKKKNFIIGNMSIKAVVGKNTRNRIKNFNILKNTSTNRIARLSNLVANGIIDVINS